MDRRASGLLTALFEIATFDEAARLTLRALLDTATEQLSTSAWAGAGQILRGIVHLRPTDGYRRLLVVEARASDDGGGHAIVPSASAWRWVAEHRCPAGVDANLGTVQLYRDGRVTGDIPLPIGRDPITSDSRVRLLARDASHILLVPLRVPGGAIDGMVAIEASCTAAIDSPFIWPDLVIAAQRLADIAGPFLRELPTERRSLAAPDPYLPVVGRSMAPLIEILRIFAEQDETVLLTGPTGSGKSRLARWCHHRSRRAGGPFEILDLATVPEELQLAELFGWRRGAFTSAARDTPGAVTRAEGGTLFVDEIDKLSQRAQAALLRVFEDRRYRPLGDGAAERAADVRFLVGTNATLRELVKSGQFREDLYYRINVLPVQVPPLSERRDEIAAWALYMLRRRHATPSGEATIAPEALERLVDHGWPGNLRQLDNIIRRAYTLSLLEAGGEPRNVTLRATHVDQAFSLEGSPADSPLLKLLAMAADAFVAEAQRLEGSPAPLKLEQLDALRGLVLAAAARRLHSKEAAFRLFGKEAAVSNRNHVRVLRAEIAKVAALREALGQPPDPALAQLPSAET